MRAADDGLERGGTTAHIRFARQHAVSGGLRFVTGTPTSLPPPAGSRGSLPSIGGGRGSCLSLSLSLALEAALAVVLLALVLLLIQGKLSNDDDLKAFAEVKGGTWSLFRYPGYYNIIDNNEYSWGTDASLVNATAAAGAPTAAPTSSPAPTIYAEENSYRILSMCASATSLEGARGIVIAACSPRRRVA